MMRDAGTNQGLTRKREAVIVYIATSTLRSKAVVWYNIWTAQGVCLLDSK